jgi:hypothetical protein
MQRSLLQNGELAGAFVVRDPRWREKIYFGGLLLLLVHPFAWPVILGYRKELIARVSSGIEPILPEWRGTIGHYFIEGVKAMGVIFGYLAPLYCALFFLLLTNGVTPSIYWLYSTLFFVVFTIFSTLSFPVAVIYWTVFSETYRLPAAVAVVLLLVFSAVVFFIPAAFLQVSKSGSYWSAFDVRAAASTLRLHFRNYLLAWYHSILLSLAGHFALPFAPWGVVWCYLGIIFAFNSILESDSAVDLSNSWFVKLRGKDAIIIEASNRPSVWRCTNPSDADFGNCYLVSLGPILIPLPKLVVAYLKLEER